MGRHISGLVVPALEFDSGTENQYLPDSLVSSDDDCDDKLDKLELYDDIKEDNINGRSYLSNYIDTTGIDKDISSPIEMSKLKEHEIALKDRKTSGYYRIRIWHTKLYRK